MCVASYAFGNHDNHRLVTRIGEPAARSAAVLLLTLPGMSFVYNGDELGLQDGSVPPELVQDPAAKSGGDYKNTLLDCRDPERTPFHWTPGQNAGFTTAHTPWLPIAENYQTRNVESELQDSDSFLNLYRTLGKLRNKSNALRYGSFELFDTGRESVLGFVRKHDGDIIATFINFSSDQFEIAPPNELSLGELVISSSKETKRDGASQNLNLAPHEAVVFAANK
jgi:alpha-glucosidase